MGDEEGREREKEKEEEKQEEEEEEGEYKKAEDEGSPGLLASARHCRSQCRNPQQPDLTLAVQYTTQ